MAKKLQLKPKIELMTWADVSMFLKGKSRSTLKRMIAKGMLTAPKAISGFRERYFLRHVVEEDIKKALGI